jgi:hypothetical protein
MFCSEENELWICGLGQRGIDATLIDESNNGFAEIVARYLNKPMDVLYRNVIGDYGELAKKNRYVKHTLPMLENLVEYYRKANGKTKNKILSCIFDGKLIIEKGRVATTLFKPEVQVLLNIVKGFQRAKKNKRSILTSCLYGSPYCSKLQLADSFPGVERAHILTGPYALQVFTKF